MLRQLQLTTCSTPADGDCLFWATDKQKMPEKIASMRMEAVSVVTAPEKQELRRHEGLPADRENAREQLRPFLAPGKWLEAENQSEYSLHPPSIFLHLPSISFTSLHLASSHTVAPPPLPVVAAQRGSSRL